MFKTAASSGGRFFALSGKEKEFFSVPEDAVFFGALSDKNPNKF